MSRSIKAYVNATSQSPPPPHTHTTTHTHTRTHTHTEQGPTRNAVQEAAALLCEVSSSNACKHMLRRHMRSPHHQPRSHIHIHSY